MKDDYLPISERLRTQSEATDSTIITLKMNAKSCLVSANEFFDKHFLIIPITFIALSATAIGLTYRYSDLFSTQNPQAASFKARIGADAFGGLLLLKTLLDCIICSVK